MTDQNNAAQLGLTDDEIRSIWVEHGLDDEAVEDFARAIESALLTKLRAEGVQAGDEVEWSGYRPLLRDAIAAKDAMHEAGIQYATFGVMFPEMMRRYAAALASAPVADNTSVIWKHTDRATRDVMLSLTDIADLPFNRERWESVPHYAALASAPVADERAPTFNAEDCNKEVYERGTFVGLFDVPKHVANEPCAGISSATGARVDWHYFGGRVRVLALASAPVAGEATSPDRAMLEAIMNDLNVSDWNCPRCGHVEECSTMDAALMLRDYLAAPQDSEAVRNAALLKKLEAWQAVCDRIVEQYGGVVAGVDFASLGRANRAALAAQPAAQKQGDSDA